MFGWSEDLIYGLCLFWIPGMLLVACIPGRPRVIVGLLVGGVFLFVWTRFMGLNLTGAALTLGPILLSFVGRKPPENGDPEAGKLLVIPFMLLFCAVAWMAMGPVWQERRKLKSLSPVQGAQLAGKPIRDLEAVRKALQHSLSCGELKLELERALPLVLETEGEHLEYRAVPYDDGLVLLEARADRQLLYSRELAEQARRSGVELPR